MLPLNYINKREGRYGSFFKKIKIDYKVKNGIERMLSVTKDLSPKLAEDMKTDLLLFLLKQVAADGLVAKEEVQYINGYLDMNASVDWMVDYLNEYIRDLIYCRTATLQTRIWKERILRCVPERVYRCMC